jgi:hypothetical protein
MKTLIIRAHCCSAHSICRRRGFLGPLALLLLFINTLSRAFAKGHAKTGLSGGSASRTNQAVKRRPEKLQSNFVSVLTQDGRSRPFNPIAPHGLQKMVSFWNRLSKKPIFGALAG